MNARFADSARLGESIDSDGSASSSVIVPVAVPMPAAMVALLGLLSVNRTVSLASSSASPITDTVIVPLMLPALIVSVPDADDAV